MPGTCLIVQSHSSTAYRPSYLFIYLFETGHYNEVSYVRVERRFFFSSRSTFIGHHCRMPNQIFITHY